MEELNGTEEGVRAVGEREKVDEPTGKSDSEVAPLAVEASSG